MERNLKDYEGLEMMPIMHGEYLKAIPWELIGPHEKQANGNHSQTLRRLADRGGLNPSEALAVIEGRDLPWGSHDPKADELRLMAMIGAN